MRILYAGCSLADPVGGGELSARALLTRLSRRHHVEAVCVGRVARDYVLDGNIRCRDEASTLLRPPAGVPFHLAAMLIEARFRPTLLARVKRCQPDLLLLQQPACLHPRDRPAGTKVIVFVRSLACYGAGDANPEPWMRVAGRPFREIRFRKNRALLAGADLIVTNSRFIERAFNRRSALRSSVVAPFIDTDALRASSAGGARACLTFVGLDGWKGAAIACALAEALPDRRFLFLDGARASARWRARAARLKNVTCLGWTDDMGAIFDRTRVLLMPSIWDEPFGRLPVEAGACGIPTLASARGGLPESVGDGGILIDPVEDLSRWIESIRNLDDPRLYAALSDAARRHAGTLGLEVTLERFGDLVRRELSIELWSPR